VFAEIFQYGPIISKKYQLKKNKILQAHLCAICYISPMFNKSINRFSAIVPALLLISEGMAAPTGGYTPPPFSHYEPILERMPFGELPDKFGQTIDPNAAKQEALLKAEQQKLASRINMSAVNITPQGVTAIGFTDLAAKPPVSYYLLVGAEAGGWTVKSADYDAETAEIEKDGISISLQLGKGLVENPAAAPPVQKIPAPNPALTALKNPAAAAPAAAAAESPLALSASIGKSTAASAAAIRDKLRAAQAQQGGAGASISVSGSDDTRSYMERLRERKIEQTKALEIAQNTQRKQLENLAREVASKEIEKQAAIAEEAALEKELVLEEERLQKQEAERLEKQDEKEIPAP